GQAGPSRSNGLFQIVLRPLEHVAKYYGSIAQITINRALERPVRPRAPGVEPPAAVEPTDRPCGRPKVKRGRSAPRSPLGAPSSSASFPVRLAGARTRGPRPPRPPGAYSGSPCG